MNGAESVGEFGRKRTGELLERLESESVRMLAWGDADSVHDLRVSVRRFDQALRTFGGLFAPSASKPIRKELKSLMRLASGVRDRDIALEFLDERRETMPVPEDLRAGPAEERTELAGELIDVLQRWRKAELTAMWKAKLLQSAGRADGAGSDRCASDVSPALLTRLAQKYFKAGRESVSRAPTEQGHRQMHRLRLKTKRFRYTLELFRPVYGEDFEARLKRLQELQRHLGKMSDALAIRRLVKRDAALAKELKLKADEELSGFRDYWRNDFDAAGEQQIWEKILGEVIQPEQNVKMV
ncbi:MAG TPA: CHAD domain-containing protein [Bryobacteraceae bacterium]|nr:CHAD domain-containing protein [Bryobacteraceae bacterium]